MENSDYTDIKWIVGRDELEKWATNELKQLFSKAVMQLDGYHIKMMWEDRDYVKFTDSGNVVFETGILIHQPAGLFSVEAFGRIQAELSFETNLSATLEINTSIKVISHSWSESPKVKIGKLLIPVESISNYVINKMEDDIRTSISHKIKESLDLPELIKQWTLKTGTNYLLSKDFGVYLNTQIDALQIHPLLLESDSVILNSQIALSAIISDRKLAFRKSNPPELLNNPQKNHVVVDLSLRWDNLSTPLMQTLKTFDYGGKPVEVENLNFSWDERLFITLDLVSPVKMKVDANLIPDFNSETGYLHLKSCKLKVTPHNFLYKLVTPVIKSAISKQIGSIFPLNLNELIQNELSAQLPEKLSLGPLDVRHSYESIKVRDCVFSKQGLDVKVDVQSFKLKVKISMDGIKQEV